MQKVDSKQGFPHGFPKQFTSIFTVAMQNPRSVSDLLSRSRNKLTALKTRAQERTLVVEQVRAVLPSRLALAVASAGIEEGRLTIGVVGAVWASRVRYLTEPVRKHVAASTGTAVVSVRVRVVPPRPGA
jgi:hypothetical protein